MSHAKQPRADRRAQDVTLSRDAGILDALQRSRRERCLAANASAITAYNKAVSRHGTFADGLRGF